MRVLDKILVVVCIASVAGVLIWSGVVLTTFYGSGANVITPQVMPMQCGVSFDIVFGKQLGHGMWWLFKGPVFLWMLCGVIGVFVFGFYFAISARGPLRRTLTVLCFLCVWIMAVVVGAHRLVEWFMD